MSLEDANYASILYICGFIFNGIRYHFGKTFNDFFYVLICFSVLFLLKNQHFFLMAAVLPTKNQFFFLIY